MSQEDQSALLDFNEDDFLTKVKSTSKVVKLTELQLWIKEINKRLHIQSEIKSVDEESLVPIVDAMLQLFEEKVEAFVEGGSLEMKELQAFYKVRTRILHMRINELNKLVDTQTEDIKNTRS